MTCTCPICLAMLLDSLTNFFIPVPFIPQFYIKFTYLSVFYLLSLLFILQRRAHSVAFIALIPQYSLLSRSWAPDDEEYLFGSGYTNVKPVSGNSLILQQKSHRVFGHQKFSGPALKIHRTKNQHIFTVTSFGGVCVHDYIRKPPSPDPWPA